MITDLMYGLLPENILLSLVLLMMVLEIFRVDGRFGRSLYLLAVASGVVLLLHQLSGGYHGEPVPNEIVIDRFALLAKLVILGCGLLLGCCSGRRSAGHKVWMLLSASLLGGMIIMDSAGVITLFLGIELLSLPAFALMVQGSRDRHAEAPEGAFKYLLLSSVASALILFGLSLAYGATGSLSIAGFVALVRTGGVPAMAACLLVLSGFFLKAALFPFHAWAPDAYAGSGVEVTSFLASVVKGTVVLALVRVLGGVALSPGAAAIITALSLASIFYGNLTAIGQVAFRRLLAYSSVAHAGYMIFALTVPGEGREEALLYYVAVYAVTTIIACTCFGMLARDGGDRLELLEGVFAARPFPAFLLALSVLSLAGIPPLPGFLAKLLVFKSVIAAGHLTAALLAFVGSYVGVAYYLGIVLRLFAAGYSSEGGSATTAAGRIMDGLVLWGALGVMVCLLIPGMF